MIAFVLLGVGSLLYLVFWIWLLVKAFQQSVIWGLITFFIPGGAIIFLAIHSDEAWKPFLGAVVSLLIACGGFYLFLQQVKDGTLPAPPEARAQLVKLGLIKEDKHAQSAATKDIMKLREDQADQINRVQKEEARLTAIYTAPTALQPLKNPRAQHRFWESSDLTPAG